MSPTLNTAIIAFLANEFKINPDQLNPDTSFVVDLGLSQDELQDLLQRLQDSLNISLPEDRLSSVTTIADLLALTEEEGASE